MLSKVTVLLPFLFPEWFFSTCSRVVNLLLPSTSHLGFASDTGLAFRYTALDNFNIELRIIFHASKFEPLLSNGTPVFGGVGLPADIFCRFRWRHGWGGDVFFAVTLLQSLNDISGNGKGRMAHAASAKLSPTADFFRQCDRAHLRPLDRMCQMPPKPYFPEQLQSLMGIRHKDIADGFYALRRKATLDHQSRWLLRHSLELRHIQIVDARHLVSVESRPARHDSNVWAFCLCPTASPAPTISPAALMMF